MTLRLKLLLCISLVLVATLGMQPAPALAQTPTITAKAVYDVNIRATPSLNSAVLVILPAGGQATALGRTSGNNWIQVKFQETTGWVAGWLVVFSNDTSALPVTTDVEPEVITPAQPVTVSSPYTLNIRAEPSTTAKVLQKLPFGDSTPALGRTSNSSWVRVDYNGTTGWVAAWLAILSGDINSLPVSGAAGSAPSGPTPTPGPARTPSTPTSPTGVFVTAPFRVNIRSAPNVNGEVLAMIPFQGTAAALGRNAGNNWIQVKYQDTTGWVAAWVVVVSDNTVGLPVVSDSTEVAAVLPTVTITGSSMYNVIVRAGPDLIFGEVGQIPASTKATLLARTADSAWVRVRYQDTTGWAAAWVMVASADMNNLPVENP